MAHGVVCHIIGLYSVFYANRRPMNTVAFSANCKNSPSDYQLLIRTVFFLCDFFPVCFTFGVSRNTILLFSMIYSPRQWLHCVSYCIRRCVYDRTTDIYKRRRRVDTIYNTDDLIFITSSGGPNNSITRRSTLLIIHCRMTSHGTLR